MSVEHAATASTSTMASAWFLSSSSTTPPRARSCARYRMAPRLARANVLSSAELVPLLSLATCVETKKYRNTSVSSAKNAPYTLSMMNQNESPSPNRSAVSASVTKNGIGPGSPSSVGRLRSRGMRASACLRASARSGGANWNASSLGSLGSETARTAGGIATRVSVAPRLGASACPTSRAEADSTTAAPEAAGAASGSPADMTRAGGDPREPRVPRVRARRSCAARAEARSERTTTTNVSLRLRLVRRFGIGWTNAIGSPPRFLHLRHGLFLVRLARCDVDRVRVSRGLRTGNQRTIFAWNERRTRLAPQHPRVSRRLAPTTPRLLDSSLRRSPHDDDRRVKKRFSS